VPLTDDRPIGMFDSGFGGLTVARAVIDLLPGEDLVYVGDTGRYPYGPRPLDEVAGYARQITPGFRAVLGPPDPQTFTRELFSEVNGTRTKISDGPVAIAVPN